MTAKLIGNRAVSGKEFEMWNAYIDEKNQQFVIEDENGIVVAFRPMPSRRYPSPGKNVLMDDYDNGIAWALVSGLVEAANRGGRIKR